MGSSTYTEEEFKKVLKNLFAEKKRVKELEKQIEDKGLQKNFYAKISGLHKQAQADDYTKLKALYYEKERELGQQKERLEKIKPILKKLIGDLKQAHAEIALLKENKPPLETVSETLTLAEKKIERLEEENRRLIEEREKVFKGEEVVAQERQQYQLLLHKYESLVSKNNLLEEGQAKSEQSIAHLTQLLEEEHSHHQRDKIYEQKEIQRLEQEKGRLVERLAESLSQVQKHGETINDLREEIQLSQKTMERTQQRELSLQEEILRLKSEAAKGAFEMAQLSKVSESQVQVVQDAHSTLEKKLEMLEGEWKREQESFAQQVLSWKEREAAFQQLEEELAATKEELQKSDLTAIRTSYEAQLLEIQEQLKERERVFDETLQCSYHQMKELVSRHADMVEALAHSQKKIEENQGVIADYEKEQLTLQASWKNAKLLCDEKDAEIRKAQQHLAKKVKEVTILNDLTERQKGQLLEMQKWLDKQTNECERLQSSLNLQRMHEEKLQTMAKERTQAAEMLTKEWQEKFLALQQDWQEKKGQLQELQKMRKTYEQMASTFSNLKNILGTSIEFPTPEEPKENPWH